MVAARLEFFDECNAFMEFLKSRTINLFKAINCK